jgi:hypothetical protein
MKILDKTEDGIIMTPADFKRTSILMSSLRIFNHCWSMIDRALANLMVGRLAH